MLRSTTRALAAASVAAFTVVALTACDPVSTAVGSAPEASHVNRPTSLRPTPQATQPAPSAPSSTSAESAGEPSVAAQLTTLAVKGRAPMTGYDRDEFGPAWLDADRNGCDTRDDMLGAYLAHVAVEPGTRGCVVVSGDLADPYTGQEIHFVKGDGTLVDIDHVVALGNAWVTGAYAWPIRERAAIANDPLNLLPVDASANRQKGDADAASWLPANKSYRCAYVARQVAVKAKYGLWVTAPEKAAMGRVLDTCPTQPALVDVTAAPVLVPVAVTDPSSSPTVSSPSPAATTSASSSSEAGGTDPRFDTCTDATAHGYGPYSRGSDPEYGWYEDRDGDGTVCE